MKIILFMAAMIIAGLTSQAFATPAQPTRAKHADGCYELTMCELGTTAAGVCTNASGDEIVLDEIPGGRHVAYLTPDDTGCTCTVNVIEADEYTTTAALRTQVGQMTCATTLKVDFTGPADRTWFEIPGGVTGGGSCTSVKATLVTCAN
jgi:hypothetical protein